ncbi:hypothetical protein KAU45_07745, partial [bacterium]|nr:hypothetical protein [bacterium]
MSRRILLPLSCLALVLSGCHTVGPLSGDALLYDGPGADPSCLAATTELLEGLGYGVYRGGPDYFNEYGCEGFRLVVFPGGDMYRYSLDLRAYTKGAIREFLREGGGYLGICGGSYFAASEVYWQDAEIPMTPLNLFEGAA